MSEESHRVLIAFASRYGTTAEIAEAMARTMREGGAAAEAKRVGDVRDLSAYDAVVVGGPIHYDNWKREIRRFVTSNADSLSSMPVAYFFTCGYLAEESNKAEKKARSYTGKLRALTGRIEPASIGQFAGVLDYSAMSLPTRFALRILLTFMGAREGDYRDWDAISAWAGEVLDMTRQTDVA